MRTRERDINKMTTAEAGEMINDCVEGIEDTREANKELEETIGLVLDADAENSPTTIADQMEKDLEHPEDFADAYEDYDFDEELA